MNGDSDGVPQSQAPTSWRDVYQLVQDAEKRLTEKINDGFGRQATVSADHEVRIRLLEATDLRQGGAISAGRALVLTVVSLASLVLAIAGYFIK